MEKYKVDYVKFRAFNGITRHQEQVDKKVLLRLLDDEMVSVRSAKRVMNSVSRG